MAIPTLNITKNWIDDTTVQEANWDNIKTPLIAWSNAIRNDIIQLGKDAFASGYSFDNDGNPNKAYTLEDQINKITQQVTGVSASVIDGMHSIICTASGITITLPDAATNGNGYRLVVKDASFTAATTPITINRAGADTIEDGLTSVKISGDGGMIEFEIYGTNWLIRSVTKEPQQVLAVTGSVSLGVRSVVCTAAPITVTLPSAATCGNGHRIKITDQAYAVGADVITIARAGADTIGNGLTSLQIVEQGGSVTLEVYGTNWIIKDGE